MADLAGRSIYAYKRNSVLESTFPRHLLNDLVATFGAKKYRLSLTIIFCRQYNFSNAMPMDADGRVFFGMSN